MGFRISDLVSLTKMAQEQQSPKAFEDSQKKSANELMNAQKALALSVDIENYIENNREAFEKSTGPIMGRINEGVLGDMLQKHFPDFQAKRQTEAKLLNLMNPVRKDITGAQASWEELRRFIGPMFPALTQSYENFHKSNREFQRSAYNSINTIVGGMKRQGINVDNFINPSTTSFHNKIQGMDPGLRNLYFGQSVKTPTVNNPRTAQEPYPR